MTRSASFDFASGTSFSTPVVAGNRPADTLTVQMLLNDGLDEIDDLATPRAGEAVDTGLYTLPEIGDEVLVAMLDQGDLFG
ncbi:MAG: hypothetical protein AAFR52_19175 [Pseudomonadota bacterium]